jgi:transcriptional regulator with XRE-family HTH domain
MVRLNIADVKRRRLALSLSYAAAAERAGFSKQQWYNIESGSGDVRLSTLGSLADALKCEPEDLLVKRKRGAK